MSRAIVLAPALVLLAQPALAQPTGPDPGDPPETPAPAPAPRDPYGAPPEQSQPARGDSAQPEQGQAAESEPEDSRPPEQATQYDNEDPTTDEQSSDSSEQEDEPRKPLGPVLPYGHPRLFLAHTGRMVPAAVIYSTTSLDTSGGLSSDIRIGLGDLAEFGIEASDQVRYATSGTDESDERVAPLFLATFKLGLPENQFFRHQPAVALVYRKSFQAEEEFHKLRTAELALVASKAFGPRFSAHLGGVIGDAEIEYQNGSKAELNEREFLDKAKFFGGIEARVKPRADIILEWSYVPRFILADRDPNPEDMRMQAQFLWGVRYELTRAVDIESGVRIGDIVDTNLIDAHIFGRLTIAFDRIKQAIGTR
jgi:hypothetical protein